MEFGKTMITWDPSLMRRGQKACGADYILIQALKKSVNRAIENFISYLTIESLLEIYSENKSVISNIKINK